MFGIECRDHSLVSSLREPLNISSFRRIPESSTSQSKVPACLNPHAHPSNYL